MSNIQGERDLRFSASDSSTNSLLDVERKARDNADINGGANGGTYKPLPSVLDQEPPAIDLGAFEYIATAPPVKKFNIINHLIKLLPTLPFLAWVPKKNDKWKETLIGDMLGGLTVGFLLIPQGMAYALIVNMDPVYGLYAGFIPALIYPFWGSSGQLSVGPVALMSVLAEEGVRRVTGELPSEDDLGYPDARERYNALMAMLALQMGVIQFLMGAFRVGAIANLLSLPVIEGFTSAGALLILFKHIKYIVGYEADGEFIETIRELIEGVSETKWQTIAYGVPAIFILLCTKFYKRGNYRFSKHARLFPDILVVMIIGILIATFFPSEEVEVLGTIPSGLPSFIIPSATAQDFVTMLPTAFIISVLAFVESTAVASKFAYQFNYRLSARRELLGLGAANIIPAFFQSFPVAGSFSRTAVAAQAGARTPCQLYFTALVMLLTLQFLTPYFVNTPNAILGAVVIVAVSTLFQPSQLYHLYKAKKRDFITAMATFFGILALGLDIGVGIGVVVGILGIMLKTAFATIRYLGRVKGTSRYEDLRQYNELIGVKGVIILQVDALVYFGNVSRLKRAVEREIERAEDKSLQMVPPYGFVIDCNRMSDLDATAAHSLVKLTHELDGKGIALRFAVIKRPNREVLKHQGMFEGEPEDSDEPYFYKTINDAVTSIVSKNRAKLT